MKCALLGREAERGHTGLDPLHQRGERAALLLDAGPHDVRLLERREAPDAHALEREPRCPDHGGLERVDDRAERGVAGPAEELQRDVIADRRDPPDIDPGIAGPALLLAAILTLIARPVAVVPFLLPFRFSLREQVLISWVGLKGAVPIILATFPLMFGIPEGRLLFNVVFFVVLVSAALQGWTLPLLATRLGLQEAPEPPPPATLELVALRDLDAEIVDYTISPTSPVAGRSVEDLRLPQGAVVALVLRGNVLIPPRGGTRLEAGDHLFVITHRGERPAVEKVFSATGA